MYFVWVRFKWTAYWWKPQWFREWKTKFVNKNGCFCRCLQLCRSFISLSLNINEKQLVCLKCQMFILLINYCFLSVSTYSLWIHPKVCGVEFLFFVSSIWSSNFERNPLFPHSQQINDSSMKLQHSLVFLLYKMNVLYWIICHGFRLKLITWASMEMVFIWHKVIVFAALNQRKFNNFQTFWHFYSIPKCLDEPEDLWLLQFFTLSVFAVNNHIISIRAIKRIDIKHSNSIESRKSND